MCLHPCLPIGVGVHQIPGRQGQGIKLVLLRTPLGLLDSARRIAKDQPARLLECVTGAAKCFDKVGNTELALSHQHGVCTSFEVEPGFIGRIGAVHRHLASAPMRLPNHLQRIPSSSLRAHLGEEVEIILDKQHYRWLDAIQRIAEGLR